MVDGHQRVESQQCIQFIPCHCMLLLEIIPHDLLCIRVALLHNLPGSEEVPKPSKMVAIRPIEPVNCFIVTSFRLEDQEVGMGVVVGAWVGNQAEGWKTLGLGVIGGT